MDQNSGEGLEGLVATAAFHHSRLMFLLMHFEVVLIHKIPLTLDTQVKAANDGREVFINPSAEIIAQERTGVGMMHDEIAQ